MQRSRQWVTTSSSLWIASSGPRLSQAQHCRPLSVRTGRYDHSIRSILKLTPAVKDQPPQQVQVTGHVRTVRAQKHHAFVKLGDGSTSEELQALLTPDQARGLGTGTAVTIQGHWMPSPGPKQPNELHAKTVDVLGACNAGLYPMQKKYQTVEFQRSIPHLRIRSHFQALLARLRSEIEYQISHHLRSQDFVRVHPPILTSSDCEGAGEVFTVQPRSQSASNADEQFFRQSKYLTVSSQLHLEAFVHEHRRVWTLAPTFRAERSDTPRHLSEFYMLEAELRTDHLSAVMLVVEQLIKAVVEELRGADWLDEVLRARLYHVEKPTDGPDLKERWSNLLDPQPWQRISYGEALKLLELAVSNGDATFERLPSAQSGLRFEHERWLVNLVGNGRPVFITHYPRFQKPFYMLPSPSRFQDPGPPNAEATGEPAECFDLLVPQMGEIAGGSLREHRLEPLMEAMQKHKLYQPAEGTTSASSTLNWYLDLRRYGSVPHGGFGLGFDRLLGYLAGVDNVRDVVPWPRYYGRCDG